MKYNSYTLPSHLHEKLPLEGRLELLLQRAEIRIQGAINHIATSNYQSLQKEIRIVKGVALGFTTEWTNLGPMITGIGEVSKDSSDAF